MDPQTPADPKTAFFYRAPYRAANSLEHQYVLQTFKTLGTEKQILGPSTPALNVLCWLKCINFVPLFPDPIYGHYGKFYVRQSTSQGHNNGN